MPVERYSFRRSRTYKEYLFCSEGPKGNILKKVHFQLFFLGKIASYNLILSDWDTEKELFDSTSVTNNGDTARVINTVFAIILDFISIFENAIVVIKGSTAARTRLYQVAINKLRDESEETLFIYGRGSNRWEHYTGNNRYSAFGISRMEYIIVEEPTLPYMKETKKHLARQEQTQYDDQYDVDMVDSSNDPFVIEKTERMKKFLEKVGLPEELVELYHRRQKRIDSRRTQ